MYLPSFLFKTSLRQQRILSSEPSGELAILPALEGEEKIWLHDLDSKSLEHNRTLLISDWSLALYLSADLAYQNGACELFSALHAQGFILYFLQGNDFLRYSHSLDLPPIYDRIEPRSRADIKKRASDCLGLAAGDIAFLDYTHLRLLMQGNTKTPVHILPEHLRASRFLLKDLMDSLTLDDIILLPSDMFENRESREIGIIDDEFLREMEVDAFSRHIPVVYELSCDLSDGSKPIDLNSLESYPPYRCELSSTTNAEGNITLRHFFPLLELSKKMRSLTLQVVSLEAHAPLPDTCHQMEELTLDTCFNQDGGELSVDTLEGVLTQFPRLKTLKITELRKLDIPMEFPSTLQTLCFEGSYFVGLGILVSLEKLDALTCLTLKACEQESDEAGRAPLTKLLPLKQLIIHDLTINDKNIALTSLLNRTPQLEMLSISHTMVRECPDLLPSALQHLKVLKLKKIRGESLLRQLATRLNDLPSLEELEVIDCDGWEYLRFGPESRLKKLTLHRNAKISDKSKVPWIYDLSHLQSLSLQAIDLEAPVSTLHLRSLTLGSVMLPLFLLHHLIENASGLQHLNLAGLYFPSAEGETLPLFSRPLHALLSLELCRYDEDELSHAQIILNASPNLRIACIKNNPLALQRPLALLQELTLHAPQGPLLDAWLENAKQLHTLRSYANAESLTKKVPAGLTLYQLPTSDEHTVPAVPLFTPFHPENALVSRPSQGYDPSQIPAIGLHQTYIIHRLCQFLTWTTPKEAQSSLSTAFKHYTEGLCVTLSSLFLHGLPGGGTTTSLLAHIEHVLSYQWTEGDKGKITNDPMLRHFFDALIQTPKIPFSPLFTGLFDLDILNELLDRICHDWDEPYCIQLTNFNHATALQITGRALYFYDPNHPNFFFPEQGTFFHKEIPSDRAKLLSCIQQSLGPAIRIDISGMLPEALTIPPKPHTRDTLLRFAHHGGLLLLLSSWREIFNYGPWDDDDKKALLQDVFQKDVNHIAFIVQIMLNEREQKPFLSCLSQWLNELGRQETLLFKSRLNEHLTSLPPPLLKQWIQALNHLQPHLTHDSYALCQTLIELSTITETQWTPIPPLSHVISPRLLAHLESPTLSHDDDVLRLFTNFPGKNKLITFDSREQIRSALFHFQHLAQTHGIPYHVIRSVDELRCSREHLLLQNDGYLSPIRGPSGPLHDFLRHHQDRPCLLFIDWSWFSASEIIRSNTLLDEERLADSTPLPAQMTVISCHDTSSPEAYLGGDFLDRHHLPHLHDTRPFSPVTHHDDIDFVEVDSWMAFGEDDPKPVSIHLNLYESPQWKTRLFGQTTFSDGGLRLIPSDFLRACLVEQAIALTLKNAPFNCPEFQAFWDDFQVNRRFTLHGRTFDLHKKTTFLYTAGYALEEVPVMTGGEAILLTLNPSTVSQFHRGYFIDGAGYPKDRQGWLETYSGQTIAYELTRSISSSEMALLLDTAKEFGVTLRSSDARSRVIERLSTSETEGVLQNPENLTICADECTFSDLFYSVTPEKTAGENMRFLPSERVVLRTLKLGKTVILKGSIQDSLMDMITPILQGRPLFINGEFITLSGRLILAEHTASDSSLVIDKSIDPDKDFEVEVTQNLMQAFHQRPLVQVCGPTGGGKSTFFMKSRALRKASSVYYGEDTLLAWAKGGGDGFHLLVLDEANLQHHTHSHFEDLHNLIPSICIQGEFYALSKKHVVAFLTNPTVYGGEREDLPILQRHPTLFVFPALTHQTLRHMLGSIISPGDPNLDFLLRTYLHLSSFKTESQAVLATPRDLQTLALLYLASHSLDSLNPILHSILPSAIRRDFEIPTDLPRELLHITLALRAYRQRTRQYVGGHCGLLISGEPGVGKSHFVMEELRREGQAFELIPAILSIKKKMDRLTAAFHEGRIVVISEFNSDSSMEAFLNALLMGYDLQGNSARIPGFTMIITQNPPQWEGRRSLSLAQHRRLLQTTYPMPTPEQMHSMLMSRSKNRLARCEITSLIDDFLRLRAAKKTMTLRTLMHVVDEMVSELPQLEKSLLCHHPNSLFKALNKRTHDKISDRVSEESSSKKEART
ncbi:MAG: hypothetical protein NTW94_09800 [Legionellales bacterium]|nr:hypothetical protein [Legionellales bacterium]